jgi:hypothetical protein
MFEINRTEKTRNEIDPAEEKKTKMEVYLAEETKTWIEIDIAGLRLWFGSIKLD